MLSAVLFDFDGTLVEIASRPDLVQELYKPHAIAWVMPDPVSGEATLEIYFRDLTNGQGSYPAGRFVELIPQADGRYRLDFNRARNPFCAYSSAYACPIPWRGNAIPAPVRAGELVAV